MDVREWISADETATEMFSRALRERPALLLPPLHRLPLRAGNVLEIAGPSPSAKSQILMQVAVNCILPAHYGGLERAVMFFDLDCRFDILRLEQLLSIGAYYWVDRASTSLPLGSRNRKMISLQSVMEAIVHEVKSSLLLQPMIVLATKASIFGDKSAANDARRTSKKFSSHDATSQSTVGGQNFSHREYMPSVWQSMITHRIFVHNSNSEVPTVSTADGHGKEQIFITEWLLPILGFTDKFVVRDAGIFII